MNESLDAKYLQTCKDNGMEVNENDVDSLREAAQTLLEYYGSKYDSDRIGLVKVAQQ